MAVHSTNTATLGPAMTGAAPVGTGGPHQAVDALLHEVAELFRPAGLLLCAIRGDGTVLSADERAAEYFTRYALPALRQSQSLPIRPQAVPVVSVRNEPLPVPALQLKPVPGLVMTGIPVGDRRQAQGPLLLLAGRGEFAADDEEVQRMCGKLGLDTAWVMSLADMLPRYTGASLDRQARLLASTMKDHGRIQSLERELESLSQQLADTYEELSLIYQLSGGMKVNRSAGDFFKQACLDVLQVMDARGMGVALSVDMQDCPPPAMYGRVVLSPAETTRLADELLVVLRQRKCPLLIDRLAADRNFGWLSVHAGQLLAVPIMRQEQVLGLLVALDKVDGEFDSVHSKLLTSIANESGIYLENAQLFDDVHGLMMGLLHSLTSAVDAKDAYTCGHSERVALVSRFIAQQMKLRDGEVERIYMAGLLHDVGKIGVPESVLQKAGRLTQEEFEQIKKHPEIGARILADVKQLKPILPGVLHHHERYDGRGYPHGLAGEKIPLMGRIICLADCFDAMTSSRTYRKALPIEVAMTEIRRCSGTQFDPFLAEAFLRTTPEALRELLRDHKERSKQLIDTQEQLRSMAA